MNATFYVISGGVNTLSYMTVTELQALQNYGCEIGSHSVTHPDFTALSDAQVQQECQVSKQTLQSWGLSVNNFAYPYGCRNSHTDAIVAQYYRSARSAYAGPFIMQFPISQFMLPGFAGETGDSTALSQLKSMVDQVYSTNGWTIIFFHNVMPDPSGNPYAISTTDFASFLDYIVSKGVATLTVNQGLDLGSPPYTPPSVTINPTSVRMYLEQSQTFNSSVSGGRPPYAYQWYLNNTAVPSPTGISWTFSPTQAGFYKVYLNVTDDRNSTVQSNIVNDIQVYNQYLLTMSTNYGTVSPSSGGYNVGSIVSISATAPVAAAGERYVWLGWTGSGAGSYTGMNNPASITMNGAITETAQWGHQYFVTFGSSGLVSDAAGTIVTVGGSAKTFGNLPFGFWVDSGSSISFGYASTVSSTVGGKQFVLTGVTASSPLVATGSTTVTGTYKTQYYLTATSAYDTPGGSGWYDSGSTAYATLINGTVSGGTGTQCVFTSWSSDASGTNYTQSNPITMDGPKTATANWKTQYYLTVTSAYGTAGGAGWYDSGTPAYATVTPLTVAGTTGTQYVFTSWNGDASGTTSPSNAIVMGGPKTATANWITQYLVTFAQSGVASDFSGAVMTVNGTNYGGAGFTTWANTGDVYTFSYVASPLVVTANGKQYLLTGVSGNSSASSLTVSAAATVTGAYKTQYYLTMTSAYDSPSPLSGWFDSGSSITGSVATPVSGGTATQYVCTGWSGTGSVPASGSASAVTFTISAPSTITWNWKTQYIVSFAVNPSAAATTNPSGTNLWQDPGTYSISATPNYGYTFSSWTTDTGNITFEFPTLSSTTTTINGPGTITANLATTPIPTPTHIPTPSASPSISPSPTLPPSQSPTIIPPSSPSQSPSTVYNIDAYSVYSIVLSLIIGGILTAVITIHRRNKSSPFQ
jgi:peptidoglycan/xylan/chitin deacetylase (PgdA/CDA1 family)